MSESGVKSQLKSLLGWTKQNWNRPVQSILSLATAIASFWQPPGPAADVLSSQSALNLTRVFLIPITWLLLRGPCLAKNLRKDSRYWGLVSGWAVLGALGLWFLSVWLSSIWTCHAKAENKDFVFGRTFTLEAIQGEIARAAIDDQIAGRPVTPISQDQALSRLKNYPNPCDLIDGRQGDVAAIWNNMEIKQRAMLLDFLYVGASPLFVIAMMAGVQSWYCAGRPR